MKNWKCNWGFHDWHKALYSEWNTANGLRPREHYYHDSQLYGTKQCERCKAWGEGYARKNHPRLRDTLKKSKI